MSLQVALNVRTALHEARACLDPDRGALTRMRALENRVHVHDLHATVLHLMGLDHEKLTCRYGGRDYRLTGVSGRVIRDIIA